MSVTRREFLQASAGSAAVVSLAGGVPAMLRQAAAAADATGGERVLVVVQLTGGNDGLNTVVPFTDQAYYGARPELALPRDQLLKINDQLGFHPALRGFADLLEAGQLAIVQGVGYPQPNRSHFESMDIWHTCLRKDQPRRDGWLGRYLERAQRTSGGDVPALHLGAEDQPLALASRSVRVPSVQSLDRFRLRLEEGNADARTIERLVTAQREQANPLLDFVRSSSESALSASQRVTAANRGYQPAATYPETELARKLRTVAQLIDSGLSTRVYYVTLDGFDTHARQAPAHAALLGQLGGAAHAFLQDVAHHGHGSRVLLACFSEFGRRVAENASGGTDHGAAAPMFLAGASVEPGTCGNHPSLSDLEEGDLKFHTDFRQVYATLLPRWLGCPSDAVLGGTFEPLKLIRSSEA